MTLKNEPDTDPLDDKKQQILIESTILILLSLNYEIYFLVICT